MAADCAQTMAAARPWFTLAAEKYFFTGGAGKKIHWNWFQRLRALEVCDAFFAPSFEEVVENRKSFLMTSSLVKALASPRGEAVTEGD